MNDIKKRILAVIFTVLLTFSLAGSALAADDDIASIPPANTLEIDVGYAGGPFYEKHTFTLDELNNMMPSVTATYTYIDNMPSVVIDHAKGIYLSELMKAAGIDLDSVQTFYFYTEDKPDKDGYFTSFTKTELIDTYRYCYPNLAYNFDSEKGEGNSCAASDAQRVEPLIALEDDWKRYIAGASFDSDYMNLDTKARFRLLFGQKDVVTHEADRSAQLIHKIEVELGGAPTLMTDNHDLSKKVGSVFRAEVRIHAVDQTIEKNAKISWSSSDESVATVDENGNITIHKKGDAVITASLFGTKKPNDVVTHIRVTGVDDPVSKDTIPSAAVPSPVATGQGDSTGSDGSAQGAGFGDGQGQNGSIVEINPQASAQKTLNSIQSNLPQNKMGQYSILPANKGTANQKGGVQNWRAYEMSPDAVELPIIKTKNPMLPVVGLLSVSLFAGGMILRFLKYKHDLEDSPHVFFRKSQ